MKVKGVLSRLCPRAIARINVLDISPFTVLLQDADLKRRL